MIYKHLYIVTKYFGGQDIPVKRAWDHIQLQLKEQEFRIHENMQQQQYLWDLAKQSKKKVSFASPSPSPKKPPSIPMIKRDDLKDESESDPEGKIYFIIFSKLMGHKFMIFCFFL